MERVYTQLDALMHMPKCWTVASHFSNPELQLKQRRHEKQCDVWSKDSDGDAPAAEADLAVYPRYVHRSLQAHITTMINHAHTLAQPHSRCLLLDAHVCAC